MARAKKSGAPQRVCGLARTATPGSASGRFVVQRSARRARVGALSHRHHPQRTSYRLTQDIENASPVLESLEEDMSSEAGGLFVDIVAEYFAATRRGAGQ